MTVFYDNSACNEQLGLFIIIEITQAFIYLSISERIMLHYLTILYCFDFLTVFALDDLKQKFIATLSGS